MDSLKSLHFSLFIIFSDDPWSLLVSFRQLFTLPLVVQCCDVIYEWPLIAYSNCWNVWKPELISDLEWSSSEFHSVSAAPSSWVRGHRRGGGVVRGDRRRGGPGGHGGQSPQRVKNRRQQQNLVKIVIDYLLGKPSAPFQVPDWLGREEVKWVSYKVYSICHQIKWYIYSLKHGPK